MNTKQTIWNKGKKVGKKPPLSPDDIQLVKLMLTNAGNIRDIALFSLAIDSSLRGCDLVLLKVGDILKGGVVLERAIIEQKKTSEAVSFSMTPYTREALRELIQTENKGVYDYLFTSQRKNKGTPLSPTHYRRLVKSWFENAGMNTEKYGSHSLRRSKVSHIYKNTGNLRVAQVLLGHKQITTTAEYLGIEENEALEIAEKYKIL